jgi:hypothetical protein
MAHEPHRKPLIPDRWNRHRILGSIGFVAVIVGASLVKGEAERYDSPFGVVVGAALVIIGSSTVLLSAAMWYRSREEI